MSEIGEDTERERKPYGARSERSEKMRRKTRIDGKGRTGTRLDSCILFSCGYCLIWFDTDFGGNPKRIAAKICVKVVTRTVDTQAVSISFRLSRICPPLFSRRLLVPFSFRRLD